MIERKLIIDETGADVPAGLSTWHRVEASTAAEALVIFSATQNAEMLGSVLWRGPIATAIVEIASRAYRLVAVPADRPMEAELKR